MSDRPAVDALNPRSVRVHALETELGSTATVVWPSWTRYTVQRLGARLASLL